MKAKDQAVIVMLTALEVEYRSIRQWLVDPRRLDHPAGTVFELGRLPGCRVRVALGVTGDGNVSAAVLAERAIATFRPRALLFVGVAGALRGDIALGDVVVATRVYAYHGGTVRPDGFHARPRAWEIPHQLDQIARHVYRAGSWVRQPLVGPPPAVHFAPVAAGEVVLNDQDSALFRQLRSTYGDAAAVEMESAGIAQAGHLNDALPVLTVRGISDRADGAKYASDASGWQAVAAANAAAFALAVAAEIGTAPSRSAAAANPRTVVSRLNAPPRSPRSRRTSLITPVLLAVLLVALVNGSGPVGAGLDASVALVGYWRLSDGSGAKADDSVGNNPGTVHGGITWSGEHGGSARFDGTGGITTTGPVVDTTKSFTVSAWVKLTSVAGYSTAVAQAGQHRQSFVLWYNADLHKWAFTRWSDDTAQPAAHYEATSDAPAALDTWTHLSAVYDASSGAIALYVNGVAQSDTDTDRTPVASTGPLSIGESVAGQWPCCNWVGSVADVRIYHRAIVE